MEKISIIGTTIGSQKMYHELSDTLTKRNNITSTIDPEKLDLFIQGLCPNYQRSFLEITKNPEDEDKILITVTQNESDPSRYKRNLNQFEQVITSNENINDIILKFAKMVNDSFDLDMELTSIDIANDTINNANSIEIFKKSLSNVSFVPGEIDIPRHWYLIDTKYLNAIDEVKSKILDIEKDYPNETGNIFGYFQNEELESLLENVPIFKKKVQKIMDIVNPINDQIIMPLIYNGPIFDFSNTKGLIDSYHELYHLVMSGRIAIYNNVTDALSRYLSRNPINNLENQEKLFSEFTRMLFSCKVASNQDIGKFKHFNNYTSDILVSVFGRSKYYVEILKSKNNMKDSE